MKFGTIVSVYGVYLYVFLLIYYLWCWYSSDLLANVAKTCLFQIHYWNATKFVSSRTFVFYPVFYRLFTYYRLHIVFRHINIPMVLYAMLEYTANYLLRTNNGIIFMELFILSTYGGEFSASESQVRVSAVLLQHEWRYCQELQHAIVAEDNIMLGTLHISKERKISRYFIIFYYLGV